MERLSTPRRIALGLIFLAGAGALAGCSNVTTEGMSSAECLTGTDTFTLPEGASFNVGDVSSHEGPFSGTKNDWFEVWNSKGAIDYGQDNLDEGKVNPADGGLDYTENDNLYMLRWENNTNDVEASVEMTVITECGGEPLDNEN